MSSQFDLAFEQIELINGLGEDKPVWLFMRASLFADSDPNTPIWSGEVGSLPDDANQPSEGFPTGDAGKYAEHLLRDQPVRNDDTSGRPRFMLPTFTMYLDQFLELSIFMLPKIWFETKKIPISDFDRGTYSGLVGLLVNFAGGGLLGQAISTILSYILNPFKEQEIDVPCLNTIITARHILRIEDVNGIFSEGMRRFGPRDNNSGMCDDIDSFYWLSVAVPQMQFAPTTPVGKAGCSLEPRAYFPKAEQFVGSWGDIGDGYSEHVRVSVELIDDHHANIYTTEQNAIGNRDYKWENCPITRSDPTPGFYRNIYDNPLLPSSSAKPSCPYCSYFKNMIFSQFFPKLLVWAGMSGGSHIGTKPIYPVRIDTDVATARQARPSPRTATKATAQEQSADRPSMHRQAEPLAFGSGLHIRDSSPEGYQVWGQGSNRLLDRKPFTSTFDPGAEVILFPELPLAWIATGEDGSFVATYAEIRNGEKCTRRLRYVRMGEGGRPIVDLMLIGYVVIR